MPQPKPRRDETEDRFMARCMSDPTMKREYEREQRLAVCRSLWRRKQRNE